MSRQGYVYILFSQENGSLYIGVTSDLINRVYEHKSKLIEGHTKKHNIDKLGYYEVYNSIVDAITREKQIKGYSRAKKLLLINEANPYWRDLYEDLV